MVSVLFARHGQSRANIGGTISSTHPGAPLTQHGRQQARDLGRLLRAAQPARVFSSSLLRAETTAQIVASQLGLADFESTPDLDEIRLADLHGTPGGPTGWGAAETAWDAWIRGDLEIRPHPTAESAAEVMRRFTGFLRSLLDDRRAETVVVVSHGGLLQLCLPVLCSNLARDHGRTHWLGNGDLVEVQIGDGGSVCISWQGRAIDPAGSTR